MSENYATDENLREVATLLYGPGVEEFWKYTDSEKKDKRTRKLTAGLSAIGATAGAAGLGYAGYKTREQYKKAPTPLVSRAKKLKYAVKNEKFGAALVPLEVAGLGGEVLATHILHGDTKKKVSKSEPTSSDIHLPTVGKLKRKAATKALTKVNESPRVEQMKVDVGNKVKKPLGKSFTWEGEFSKVDEDKRQVFGWASIVEMGGEPVYDMQGDYIEMDEIEKSAYDYVIKSRKGGDMHRRNTDNTPVHSSDMIESFLVTPEKIEKMGIPEGSLPTGWWVGFQVNDDDAWDLVKSGKRTAFSIHGRGQRTPMEA